MLAIMSEYKRKSEHPCYGHFLRMLDVSLPVTVEITTTRQKKIYDQALGDCGKEKLPLIRKKPPAEADSDRSNHLL